MTIPDFTSSFKTLEELKAASQTALDRMKQLNGISMLAGAVVLGGVGTASGAMQSRQQDESMGQHVFGRIDGLDDIMIRRHPGTERFRNPEHALDFVISAVETFEELLKLGFDSPENAKERLDVAQRAVARYVAMRFE